MPAPSLGSSSDCCFLSLPNPTPPLSPGGCLSTSMWWDSQRCFLDSRFVWNELQGQHKSLGARISGFKLLREDVPCPTIPGRPQPFNTRMVGCLRISGVARKPRGTNRAEVWTRLKILAGAPPGLSLSLSLGYFDGTLCVSVPRSLSECGSVDIMLLLQVPVKYLCWAELVVASLFNPRASFLGHLTGIVAGFIHVKAGLGGP